MSEQEQFLKDLDASNRPPDVLETPLTPAKEEGGTQGADDTTKHEEGDEKPEPKNRRERRLVAKLEAERESSKEMADRLSAMAEAKRTTEEADYLKKVERIYGTDSPEAQMATTLLKEAIIGARDEAKREAIEEIRAERRSEAAEERQASETLDTFVDEIEEEYNVTFTEPQERAYFQLLEKMSPKDRDGNVIEYADPHAVYEVFQERMQKKPADTRAKDLSSRSMVHSGAAAETKSVDDATARYLKENGII